MPGREIDLVLLYYDPRPKALQLTTSKEQAVHSFVLIIEVKQHSSDLIRFEGTKVLVRYDQQWSDATAQCDAQTYELKRYQKSPYKGRNRRQPTFVQRMIWLARASRSAFDGTPAESSVPVQFSELNWQEIVDGLVINEAFGKPIGEVRTLVDNLKFSTYHSIDTVRDLLTHKVMPTRLDLKRVNALTKTRFDTEKTAYIQNLGTGLLILRGRGGTGKTFALIQIALHLARQNKKTAILTYNHGLIADVSRALQFIQSKEPRLDPIPIIQTRYSYIQDLFIQAQGATEENRIRDISDLNKREEERMNRLMSEGKNLKPQFDFVLIDEGQDWTEDQRDFIFQLFGPEGVVVADGVDQFVSQDRCKWDRGNIPINRKHGLRASRRTKAATCQTVAEIAHELGLSDWDLTPDPNTHGGRFTVIVEPDARLAVDRGLAIIGSDQREESTVKAVDNLVCLPSSKMAMGTNYSSLFDQAIEKSDRDSWRGFEPEDRRIYPVRESQLRAVQYHSCRGMEGWTTVCFGLDTFFDFQHRNPRIDSALRNEQMALQLESTLEDDISKEARLFAANWLMIPLTRSIDHLVIHLTDRKSELGEILWRINERIPGSIEWINC